jgi:hypothetical protein
MVDHSIGVDSDSSLSASLDHIAKLLSSTVTAIKLVAHWLVVEPPGVELSILCPFIREDALLRRENFDSHPAHLGKVWALLFNILIGPSEQLDNGSLLALVIH